MADTDRRAHLTKWVAAEFPDWSKPMHDLIVDVMAADSYWYIHSTDACSVTFGRLIERDGQWPFDMELVKVSVDWAGRMKRAQRSKLIQLDGGRGHRTARAFLRLPDGSAS